MSDRADRTLFRQMPAIVIRAGAPGDEKLLAYIQTESWKAAFRDILPVDTLERLTDWGKAEEMYERVLQNPEIHTALEFVDGSPQGITAWSKNRSGMGGDTAELICIHSLPAGWGRGFGSAMLEQALEEMAWAGFNRVILWVFTENTRARRFYERHGFRAAGPVQDGFGAEEMLYERPLSGQETEKG